MTRLGDGASAGLAGGRNVDISSDSDVNGFVGGPDDTEVDFGVCAISGRAGRMNPIGRRGEAAPAPSFEKSSRRIVLSLIGRSSGSSSGVSARFGAAPGGGGVLGVVPSRAESSSDRAGMCGRGGVGGRGTRSHGGDADGLVVSSSVFERKMSRAGVGCAAGAKRCEGGRGPSGRRAWVGVVMGRPASVYRIAFLG